MNKEYLNSSFVYGTIGSVLALFAGITAVVVSENIKATLGGMDMLGLGSDLTAFMQKNGLVLTMTQEIVSIVAVFVVIVGNGVVKARPLVSFILTTAGCVTMSVTMSYYTVVLPVAFLVPAIFFAFLGGGPGMTQILGSVARQAAAAAKSTSQAVKNADDSLQR